MERRSLFSKIFGSKKDGNVMQRLELISDTSNTFYSWNKNIVDSDIVRSAIRPKANAVGKLTAKHVRKAGDNLQINRDPYIREILEFPNQYMSMQDFLTKMMWQRELNNNAFAFLKRNEFGRVSEIYPMPSTSVELLEKDDNVFAKFWFNNGKYIVIPYEDVIHLRKDFCNSDFFGEDGLKAISNVMEIINTTDQGVVKAIKNRALIKWIMMFKSVLQPGDRQFEIDSFVKNYLKIDTSSGIATSDPRYDLKQVEEKPFVPNSSQMDKSVQRLYSYFGVNDNIVQNKADENQMNAFYEAEIEPMLIQLSNAFTRAFFSKGERGFGNKIVFEASNLAYASMNTKLGLWQMVDRGAMLPNEWRAVLNLGPVEGGDKPIRRLDTKPVDTKPAEDDGGNDGKGTV